MVAFTKGADITNDVDYIIDITTSIEEEKCSIMEITILLPHAVGIQTSLTIV